MRITGWNPARSSEVHHTMDAAFHDHWGHTDRTEEMRQEVLGSRAFRADWSLLALDEDRVIGAALKCAYEQDWAATGTREGYTDQLGVTSSHRGLGVTRALLTKSIHRFAAAGLDAAALGVNAANRSGALRLYESLGYSQTASTCVHQATHPGAAWERPHQSSHGADRTKRMQVSAADG